MRGETCGGSYMTFSLMKKGDSIAGFFSSSGGRGAVMTSLKSMVISSEVITEPRPPEEEKKPAIESPFYISENVMYDPPHVSPRIRAQDGVLMACHQPMEPLEEKDYLEIIIKNEAHDDIRR